MSDADAVLDLEPDDLDGHTIDELEDYLDRGRSPADPGIDSSPACQIALGALQRLRSAAGMLLTGDDDSERSDDDWIAGALASISLEAHAGRRFPIPLAPARLSGVVTEGALRGLIRAIGDDVPGVLVGSVRIETDGVPAEATIRVQVAIVLGSAIPETVVRLRAALAEGLAPHLPFRVRALDLHVADVLDLREPRR